MIEHETVYPGFAPSPAASAPPVEAVVPPDMVWNSSPAAVDPGLVLEVVDMDQFLDLLGEVVGQPEPVPNFMEVPFTEYSTTEGLLLILLLSVLMSGLWSMIKGVF